MGAPLCLRRPQFSSETVSFAAATQMRQVIYLRRCIKMKLYKLLKTVAARHIHFVAAHLFNRTLSKPFDYQIKDGEEYSKDNNKAENNE